MSFKIKIANKTDKYKSIIVSAFINYFCVQSFFSIIKETKK